MWQLKTKNRINRPLIADPWTKTGKICTQSPNNAFTHIQEWLQTAETILSN